jgi:poly(A) polymerase
MKKCLKSGIFKIISAIADEERVNVYVVGGYVRDCLLGRPSKDIDIVVIGNGITFAEKLAEKTGKSKVSIFKNFGTAMLRYRDLEIEIVGARKESYRNNSRKPEVEEGSLEEDQNRRDFTINAMALGLNAENFGQLLDPFEGTKDLQNKIIRTPLEADATFSDDPLRMLRAVRFASRLNFTIEENTLASISRNKERIQIVSAERISDELNKIILCERPSIGFKLLEDTGLLKLIFPELSALKGVDKKNGQGHKDNFYHTLQVLDNLSEKTDNLWLRWAALLHDIAKPRTKKFEYQAGWTFHGHEVLGMKMIPSIFKRLKMPLNDRMKYVQKLVGLHLRPIALAQDEISDSAVRRLLFEAGEDTDDLMLLCEADITSKNETKVKKYLRNFQLVRKKLIDIEEKDKVRNFQPPVSGDMIQTAFGIKPGKEIGIIKNTIKEAILEGEIPNEYQAAWDLMKKTGEGLGLKIVSENG